VLFGFHSSLSFPLFFIDVVFVVAFSCMMSAHVILVLFSVCHGKAARRNSSSTDSDVNILRFVSNAAALPPFSSNAAVLPPFPSCYDYSKEGLELLLHDLWLLRASWVAVSSPRPLFLDRQRRSMSAFTGRWTMLSTFYEMMVMGHSMPFSVKHWTTHPRALL
jgi:hypothetical protein